MPQANGEFVKVYLYLLRCVQSHAYNFTISEIADKFNNTEMDVIRALRYWQKAGIVNLDEDPTGQICGIHMLSFDQENPVNALDSVNNPSAASASVQTQPLGSTTAAAAPQTEVLQPSDHVASAKAEKVKTILEAASAFNTPVSDTVSTPAKRKYTLDEISEFRKDESVSELLFIVETYIRHPLSESDVNTVLYWREELHFSNDLIVYLLEYCISKGHSSMRYLDKVAIGWHANNITTVEQAKEDAAIHSQAYYGVMKALGITGRSLVESETAFIRKWTKEYAFDLALIQEACSRTISATHQPSFEYADSILTKWHTSNIRNSEDVRKADEQFEAGKAAKASKSGNVIRQNANRFNNYQQRPKKSDDWYNSLLSNNN